MNTKLITKYILPIFIMIGSVVGGLYFATNKIPNYMENKTSIKKKNEVIADLNRSIEAAKTSQVQETTSTEKEEKLIFKPETASSDYMINYSSMLESILEIAKQAGMKTKSIDFKSIPESDPIKKNHAATHDGSLLAAQMVGTYTELQNFLREIYRHQNLIGINKIEISPYAMDKKILIVDIELILYTQK